MVWELSYPLWWVKPNWQLNTMSSSLPRHVYDTKWQGDIFATSRLATWLNGSSCSVFFRVYQPTPETPRLTTKSNCDVKARRNVMNIHLKGIVTKSCWKWIGIDFQVSEWLRPVIKCSHGTRTLNHAITSSHVFLLSWGLLQFVILTNVLNYYLEVTYWSEININHQPEERDNPG